ncbi:MAG: hypothetical protein ABI882_01390 [Acidobacteriota bacterium]
MRKATLIKKDSPAQEQLTQARKARKVREPKPEPVRSALEVTTEWLKKRREAGSSARETFAALFTNSDPQSA